jgi:N-acetylneuraminic acid mutarotase
MLEIACMMRASSKPASTYTKITPTGINPAASYDMAASVRGDGTVWFTGGSNSSQSNLVFDTTTKAISSRTVTFDMLQGRTTWLNDLLYGTWGLNGGSTRLFARTYNPNTNTWAGIADMPYYNANGFAGTYNGLLLTYGNTTSLREYTPGTNLWRNRSIAAPRPSSIVGFAGAIVDNMLYFAGGNGPSADTWALNLDTLLWTPKAPMPEARTGVMGFAQIGRTLYLYGGQAADGFKRSLMAYDIDADSWTLYDEAPATVTVAQRGGFVAVGPKLYLFNGLNAAGSLVQGLWEVTP